MTAYGRQRQPGKIDPLAVAPVSPDSVSGLKLWLKADGVLWQDAARTTPATADSAPVGCWDDASGVGNHFTQATAGNRPLLRTAIVNGHPVIRFDGSNDTLLTTTATGLDSASFTQLAVVKKSAAGSMDILGTGSSAGSGNTEWFFASDNPRLDQENVAVSVTGTAAMGTTTFKAIGVCHDASGVPFAFMSGVTGGTGTVRSFNAGPNGWVGSERALAQFLNGDIAEIVRYNRALTLAEINVVGQYFATRYAIAWAGL